MKSNSSKIPVGLAVLAAAILGLIFFLRLTAPSLPEEEAKEAPEAAKTPPTAPAANPLADKLQAMHRGMEEAGRKRRENWEKNFPFKPTYHPTLVHDPERYDANNPATFSGDPEMKMAVKRHSYMVCFFNNPQRFSAEFEQIYHLLGEIDREDNPEVMGDVFNHLRFYHRARLFDPESLYSRMKYRPYDPERDPPDPGIMVHGVEEWTPVDGKTTFGDRANSYSNAIVELLVSPRFWPEREPLDAHTAREMRDRLLWEIPSENIVKMPIIPTLPNGEQAGFFGYDGDVQRSLKAGDRLLTPFPHHAAPSGEPNR
ncbi:MAG: hypothetical protein M2R45_00052 [Verrucomicrobia subdivision 3 bacterium]|nr:hypothetical protein [Limisphaerales bacterium]